MIPAPASFCLTNEPHKAAEEDYLMSTLNVRTGEDVPKRPPSHRDDGPDLPDWTYGEPFRWRGFWCRVRRVGIPAAKERGLELVAYYLELADDDGRFLRMRCTLDETEIEADLAELTRDQLRKEALSAYADGQQRGVGVSWFDEDYGADPGPHPDPVRRRLAHELHVEMSRHGVKDHYAFAAQVLGRKVEHLSRLSSPERNEIRLVLASGGLEV